MNSVQELGEATRLGIPMLYKSNARNHIDPNARAGINESAGAFTAFPKEAGIAAAALGEEACAPGRIRPPATCRSSRTSPSVMGDEWASIGLRGMYGYMADLSTEPRWYRAHETFTEDADLNSNIMTTLVQSLQGPLDDEGSSLSPDTSVALTMKHFPGGGPQELGLDAHYSFGKTQVYPGDAFGEHLKPFEAAIKAGVSSIMPYYGAPVEVTHDGVTYDPTGMAFSKQIVNDLLRDKLGFKGYVNSDTGIINDRAWGLEDKTSPRARCSCHQRRHRHPLRLPRRQDDHRPGRFRTADRGAHHARRHATDRTDVQHGPVREPVRRRGSRERRGRQRGEPRGGPGPAAQVRRPVAEQGNRRRRQGPAAQAGIRRLRPGRHLRRRRSPSYGYNVTNGNTKDPAARPSAKDSDVALINITVNNANTGSYVSNDPDSGMNPEHINPVTLEGVAGLDGQSPYGAADACVTQGAPTCTDDGLRFGGSLPWESSILDFTSMAESESWKITPSLETIKQVMGEVEDPSKVVLHVYFRQPFVMDEASGLRDAGAIVAGFGMSDTALLDILSGKVAPQGRMPFALAGTAEAIREQYSDLPGYEETTDGELYPFGFGLGY